MDTFSTVYGRFVKDAEEIILTKNERGGFSMKMGAKLNSKSGEQVDVEITFPSVFASFDVRPDNNDEIAQIIVLDEK